MPTHESKSSQAQLYCRHLIQQFWVCAQSPKIVALPSALETTFGTSDEDTTFYGLHHTEGGSTGTAQPSTPVSYPRQGWKWCTQGSAVPTQVKPLCLRAQQDSSQPCLNHQDVAKRILTVFHQTNFHYCCLDCLHHFLMQNRLGALSIYYGIFFCWCRNPFQYLE